MELVLQSVNYHDCPIGRREKVSLANGQQQEMLRARAFMWFGRWNEALAELESFQKVQPDNPFQIDAQFYLARIRYEKGSKEEARKMWNDFAQAYPRHPLASQAREWAKKP